MNLESHEAANAFPMMDEDRFAELKDSISEVGLRVPIILCEGKILDGRNRYRACVEVGAELRTEVYDGDPWSEAWRLNGARRDLEAGQRGAIRLRCDRGSDDWNEKQRKRQEKANKARAAALEERRGSDGRSTSALSHDNALVEDTKKPDNRAHKELAKRAGVSEATAARVQAVANKDEDLFNKVADGKIKLTEAMREIKKREVSDSIAELPQDKFRVIYADPPWKYNDSRAGLDGYSKTAAEDHYPTMSVAELSALDVRSMAADDAVLFCWATFPLLPDALEVVKAWGFKYKTAFVWAKGRPNFGHYHNANAELLLVCTRGRCTPDADKRESQVQEVERTGRHSAKPEDFRAMVDRLYPNGKRIEMFRRGEAPDGWEVWGNESV